MGDATGNAAAVVEARAWIGTPFVHGASLRGAGADCLGLIRGVWRAVVGDEPIDGLDYGAQWAASDPGLLLDGLRKNLTPVDAAAPGDVLALRLAAMGPACSGVRHLGLLSSKNGAPTLIHAWSGRGVVESPLGEAWRRLIVARFRFPERVT